MRAGFEKATLYSFGVVLLFLLIELRSLRLALLAMVPLSMGLLWLLEALPLLGIDFNVPTRRIDMGHRHAMLQHFLQ